jgi:hypothetical protein
MEEIMDILAPFSFNGNKDQIDFNQYIHPDVPNRKALSELLYKHIDFGSLFSQDEIMDAVHN